MDGCTKGGQTVRNAAATRQAILDAARRQFARDSYENVGVRHIAGEAGVDPALVIRYFGGKEQLFREVLDNGKPDSFLEGVEAEKLPAHLVACVMDQVESCADAAAKTERLLIILRSATSLQASAIVHDAMDEFILEPIASLLGAPDGRLRACLALTVMMGSGVFRQIMNAKPVCDVGDTILRQRLQELFEAALASSGPCNDDAFPRREGNVS